MKSIFIDCNNQLAPVFARVRRPDDPPIAVNSDAFQSADLPRLLVGYDICLDDHSYMPTEVMAHCRGLKHIVFLGTGASSYMDVPALNGLGIKVHTIKGYGDIAVAEHTMALIFACCRDLARMDRAVRGGVWDPLESMQLNGKTLGLIGLGGIGREVARIARGVGMEVIGWNRSARPEVGVPLVGLEEARGEPGLPLGQSADQRNLGISTSHTSGLLQSAKQDRAASDTPFKVAAQAGPRAGAHGERDAHLPCGLPDARSLGDADAAGSRHRMRDRRAILVRLTAPLNLYGH